MSETAPPASPVRVSVVGGGSWGTSFARLLARNGCRVELLCRRPAQAAAINREHRNPDYLQHVDLPEDLVATSFSENSLGEASLVVIALPSKVYREAVHNLARNINSGAAVLSLTKGIERESLKRFSRVLGEELPEPVRRRVAVLSGPNHAEEVALDIPAAATIAAVDAGLARWLQELVSNGSFRAYVNTDMAGVEFCGAAKNVIALAAGMSDGLGLGDNTKASLMTRGLAEMARLGERLGARQQTFSGLAGMGDLIATCTSRHSRNRRAGELIAGGMTPAAAEAELGMIAEGIITAPSLRELARRHSVEMPITEQVCAVLEGKSVRDALFELMSRSPRAETDTG